MPFVRATEKRARARAKKAAAAAIEIAASEETDGAKDQALGGQVTHPASRGPGLCEPDSTDEEPQAEAKIADTVASQGTPSEPASQGGSQDRRERRAHRVDAQAKMGKSTSTEVRETSTEE